MHTCMHLRNISAIFPALTQPSAECLIHALITARLEFCNSLYAGIPQVNLNKLQHVQDAVRFVSSPALQGIRTYYCSALTFAGNLLHTEYD